MSTLRQMGQAWPCVQYASFALFYLLTREECVEGIHHFSHAFYFSVQTSATIGAPACLQAAMPRLPSAPLCPLLLSSALHSSACKGDLPS